MYPANQYMDPHYSHCRDHAPYPYYPPPGWQVGHPQMAMDSSYRPPSYGPQPYGAGMSHSHPPEFHSCCSHTYPPGYYSFRPQFPQEFPSAHLYYHGPFPNHPNTCPSFFVQPPPYPVDQTPYSYDKFKSHCCGCPNHVCHGGQKSNLKIEEERLEVKPENEHKVADNSSIIRQPNYQYPVMWLPSGNMKDKDNGRSFELPTQLLSPWLSENVERIADAKQQEQDKQFQWPIFWMPAGYDEPKQEAKQLKETNASQKVTEDPSSPKIKIIPLSWFENGHNDQKPTAIDGSGDDNGRPVVTKKSATPKHSDGMTSDDVVVDEKCKTTPVTSEEPNNENKPAGKNYKTIPVVSDKDGDEKKVGGACRTIPVITQKESDDKKSSLGENKEGKKPSNAKKEEDEIKKDVASSKAKHSKLPPVCLRVDPLPRKKSGNGSSRSASPPIKKDLEKNKDIKESQSKSDAKKEIAESQSKLDPKKDITVSKIKENLRDETNKRMGSKDVTVQADSEKNTKEEQVPTSMVGQNVQPSSNFEDGENAGSKILQGCEQSTNEDEVEIQGEAGKSARKRGTNLSETEAVVRIQSACRGYYVRRWQPLEKLRMIKSVCEQMQHVKSQLQVLEASSKQLTVKEQVAINETIMSLLLKLDTIQGLHSSVRDARKSVAQELVRLQEKLDSLCNQPSSETDHSRSEEEKPHISENAIQTTGHVSTAGASEEEKYGGSSEEQGSSSINLESIHKEFTSGVPIEQAKEYLIEDSNTAKEEATDEGKSTALDECQGLSSENVMRDADLSGHSTKQKHQMEESSIMSREESPEEKSATNAQEENVSSKDNKEPCHDSALSLNSSVMKQCRDSTEYNLNTKESDIEVFPAATEDGTTAVAATFGDSGGAVDKECSVEGQVHESATVESSELKHDVPCSEKYQLEEADSPFVHLMGSSVSMKDAELDGNAPAFADASIVSSPEDRLEEDRDDNMQKQVTDAMQDSTKRPHGTPDTSVHTSNLDSFSHADAENCAESPLLEETSQSNSALKQTALEDSKTTKRREVPRKDDSTLVDGQNEPMETETTEQREVSSKEDSTVDRQNEPMENLTEVSSIGHRPLTSEYEAGATENALDISGDPSNMVAESALPETEAKVHENPDSRVLLESQSDTRKEHCDGGKGSGVMEVSETVECNKTLEEASLCASGTHTADAEACNLKENVGMQIAPEEAASVSATPVGLKNDDQNKLVEENQKLKDMLQKLLASGNDQMGVITELTEKVKTLERKLARKKRPKVRVRKQVGNATAKAH